VTSFFEFAPSRPASDPPLGPHAKFQAWHRRKAMEKLAEQSETFSDPIAGVQGESS